MNTYDVFEKFQSGFCARHSTETALIKVTKDLLLTADAGDCSILILLDLSSAYGTVDHSILLNHLEKWVGIRDNTLRWFKSHLYDRSFSVAMGNASSSVAPLTCGVPQGSILGSLLFSIYMLPLGDIINKHKIQYHCYADDTHIYVPLKTGEGGNSYHLLSCLSDIKRWMSQNLLQLN